MISRSARKCLGAWGAVLGVALILRLIGLSTRGIWYDDAFSYFLARRNLGEIITGTAADTMPPLYYLLLHLWMQLGRDITTLRLLSVLLSLSVVAATFWLTRALFGLRAATAAGVLTAVSPFHVYHAQELRMYSVLCLSLLLHVGFFSAVYLDQPRSPRVCWLGLIISGAAAMYSHNLAIFTLVSANLLLLLQGRWHLLGQLLLAQTGMLVLAAPWIVLVPGQVAKVQRAFWTPRPGLLEVMQAFVTIHTDLPAPKWMLPVALMTSVLTATIITYELVRDQEHPPRIHLLLSFAGFPPLLTLMTSYIMRPVFVPRGFILSSVAYYALAAVVLTKRTPRWIGALSLVTFVCVATMALPSTYAFGAFPRSPFRAAGVFLTRRLVEGDIILHDNKLSFLPMLYYEPDLPQTFLPDQPGSHNDTLAPATQKAMHIYPSTSLEEATDGASRVWFVFFARSVREWEDQGRSHPTLEALERTFARTDHVTFNDLEILLFEQR